MENGESNRMNESKKSNQSNLCCCFLRLHKRNYVPSLPTYNLLATVYASILAHIRLYIHNNIIYDYPLREIYDGVNNNNNKIDT